MVEISKDSCKIVVILTFIVLLFCCIGIDYIPEHVTNETLNHPLVRFSVLAIMAVMFSYDHYAGVVIGFTYLLILHKLSMRNESKIISGKSLRKKEIDFESSPTIVPVKKPSKEELEIPSIDIEQDDMFNKTADTEFTSEFQFKDDQSNVVCTDAMKTEIRTWDTGYGPQGGIA